MKKFYFSVLYILIVFSSVAQINEGLTSEERAYLFHIVKKSPILDNNLGRYFDYQGPEILFPNKTINYDSTELLIINNPELLVIRKEELSKSPKGLLSEAANKMALWELNKVLHEKRADEFVKYENQYNEFEGYLTEKLPPAAFRIENGVNKPHPKVQQLINPSLTLDEKVAVLDNLKFLSIDEQLQTLRSLNYAINQYVEKRALTIYKELGGQAEQFNNIIIAAGDGSSTTGLLEEREKDEKGRWNKGLPKAVGLFPYILELQKTEIKKKTIEKIEPLRYTVHNFQTPGNELNTNIHLDVWGYNTEKQTTVVIEKNGLNYHLFGSEETRFLSPDSTFSSGATFQAVINDLEFNKIAKIYDQIYGKKGFDYWIEYNTKKMNSTELKIEKKEKEYSDLGYSPITTSSKPSRKVKKSKRKAIKQGKSTFNGTPTTESGRKSRKKLQAEIVDLYGRFETYKQNIKILEEEKAEAIDKMNLYKLRLDRYKMLMGRNWAQYTVQDNLYIFEDSSTFDFYTQEFQFKGTDQPEAFEIRLIAIPETALSDVVDEVMMHINVTDALPNYDARINLQFEDVFASDKWDLNQKLFTAKDSVSLMVFFEQLQDSKTDFEIIARGNGIGQWNGSRTVKNWSPKEEKSYSKDKMDSSYLRLRKSELIIDVNRGIELNVNSYTDPVVSNISIDNETIQQVANKYGLSKNDILSAYRTATIMKKLKDEVNQLAGNYLSRDKAKIVIDRFNKEWVKTKISIGKTSIDLQEFL